MWTRELGKRLREARLRRGWEVSDLAHHAELGTATIYNLERGARSDGKKFDPRHSTYARAVRAVGDAALAEEIGVDLPDPDESPSLRSNNVDAYRDIIERKVRPAMQTLNIAIEEAIEEAVREARGL